MHITIVYMYFKLSRVLCSNFRFIAIIEVDKIASCLFNEFCNYDKVATCLFDESNNCLTVSSNLLCPCTLVPSTMIGAKTMLLSHKKNIVL